MRSDFPARLGQELLKKSEACVALATSGDISSARSLLDELRFIRHLFANELASKQRNIDLENIEEKHKSLILALNDALETLQKWLASIRSNFAPEDLLGSAEGVEIFLDVNLPLTWNWGEDLTLVSGSLPDEVTRALVARGQQKVIVLKNGQDTDTVKYVGDPSDAFDSLASWKTCHIEKSLLLASSASESPPRDLIDEVSTVLKDFRIAQNTRSYHAKPWVLQQIQSLRFVITSRSIADLEPEFKGKHCLVVSPGPSLKNNVELLKNKSQGQLIIAVAQAAPALALHSIVPDYIVVMDPADYSFVLDNTDCSKVKGLIIGDACHQAFFEKTFPRLYTFYNVKASFNVDRITDSDMLLPGGSVSVGATILALMFGASHLSLVGQDLAISEGRYYGGFKDISDRPISQISVPGYFGADVFTKPEYASFIREFERLALVYGTATKLHNCTEGGAFIDGFAHVPLAEAIKLPGNQKDVFVPEPIPLSEIDRRFELLSKELKDERLLLSQTNRLATECAKLIGKIENPTDPKLKALANKEKKLSQCTDNSTTLQVFCHLETSSILRQIKNARTFEENKQLSLKMYRNLIQASSDLRQEVSKQLQNNLKTS